ncbi:N-acetylglucosamine kinase [Mucilaginibacter auburnensis]|uniref:N-acetylglucosamine kinase-like BadF-type ATPase n=1 Tax=Mucilaginibacter auburnensis TaxID=1457233 RepID=A0A2H9VPB2_9SPHI|nr:N-acetylglucosamine kinase [Mucilaginibacter auburnensis]PJJ80163.1 N-acetylglucosamine kinase-like BadF-type ATPase [Mucilaginibacter auburnensis]
MILVADSGSSKTDWLLTQPDGDPIEFRTPGLNPYFLTEKEIVKILQDRGADMLAYAAKVTEIYFFGAGCSGPDRHEIVSNALSQLFTKAYISVDSDLLGSAYATCGHERGLVCVLGTGSNISFFDGEDTHSGKHGLGFILGDEGSGNWFGKMLITDFLYGHMPPEVQTLFENTYELSKEIVMQNVYQKPAANAYLASFARFLNVVRRTDYGQELLKKGLTEFIETNIKSYPQYHDHKCHFVGSIAHTFTPELTALCKANGIHVGKIIKQPIFDLLRFILSREEQ